MDFYPHISGEKIKLKATYLESPSKFMYSQFQIPFSGYHRPFFSRNWERGCTALRVRNEGVSGFLYHLECILVKETE
jgi:hypothetical protein